MVNLFLMDGDRQLKEEQLTLPSESALLKLSPLGIVSQVDYASS
jgi:hypothetical protein